MEFGISSDRLDVRAWLEAGGFGRFADAFESRQIDGHALPLLTDAHLQELGIPLGPRVKLLAAIARLAAAQPAVAERRRMTVMFVDLAGSMTLSGRLDPEDLRNLMRAYQRTVATEVARFDGHVAQYLGDGVLTYFGYPKAHEDDAERAIRAALAIIRAVSAHRAPDGQPLAAHIGIATGLVVVGDLLVGGAVPEHAGFGHTPNVAARLVALAAPGEVVVSAATLELTGNLFEARDLGPHALKGMPAPLAVYSVLGERTVETRFQARRGSHVPAMVGREGDLALLADRWRRAAGGEGQVVLLTGEAGIGKSRLLRALEDMLAGIAHTRISNQCSPYHADSALHPMIQQLTRAAGISAADAADTQFGRLEALLQGAPRAEAALIAALLGIDAPGLGKPDLTPEQQRLRTFDALVNQLARVSEQAPVFWVLEDAHWIDPTTLELVDLCLERIADIPVLAVITARPDFRHDPGNRSHITRMSLGRLSRREIAAMVTNLAGGRSLPEAVLREITEKADGVPLFVEELTKAVLESGALRETDEAYVLEGAMHGLAVPASLHDSMMARLDRHPGLKEVAQSAACIGREFSHELLATVSRVPEERLRDALARLERAGLVFRRSAAQAGQYAFKHALVRDAAYESLLKASRQEVHARIFAELQARTGTPPEILAQHAAEAGFTEIAIDCWQKAGAQAIMRPAYQEAISHINQALQLADRMARTRPWLERRLQLVTLLGQATIPLRGYSHSQTVAAFTRAQELIAALGGDAPHSFSVSYAMWVAYYVRGEHAKAFGVAQGMRLRAQRERSDSRMLTALRALGISQMITGEPETAHATFEEAHQLARIVQQQSREHRIAVAHRFAADPELATQFHVALTLWALGRIDQASRLVAQTIKAARAMGHAHTLGHALAHGAIFAVVVRNAPEALRLSAETIRFAGEHDMDLWRGYGSILNGFARVLSGDAAGSVAVMESGLRLVTRTQTGTMVPTHRAVYAYGLAKMGRFEDAAREAARVQEELRSGSERYFWPECLRWLGDYLRLVPHSTPEAVENAYASALSFAREQRAKSWELCAATSLARFWAEQGAPGKALDLLVPLRAAFSEGAGTTALVEASALIGSLRRR